MVEFIRNQKRNKTIYLYGASTKGNTLLQYYQLDSSDIPYAAEEVLKNGINTLLGQE